MRPHPLDIYDCCSWANTIEVARARLLGFHRFIGAADMCAVEIRAVLSTKVVWG